VKSWLTPVFASREMACLPKPELLGQRDVEFVMETHFNAA
jgi:hypothetical protein